MRNKSKPAKKTEKEVGEKDEILFSECRKILNKNGNRFSDDEIIEVRDFV